MGQLEDMALFVRIVEAGGIGKASDQLNIAKSAVSRRLSDLEFKLKTQLIHRTTRKWSVTEAGDTFYQQAKNIIDDVSHLNARIIGTPEKLEGKLKISAPLSFGMLHLNKIVDEFCRQHPNLTIQLDLTDRHVDLVEEGYEIAIRIGNLKDSSLRAKKINVVRHNLVASPEYIEKRGSPVNPEDLKEHSFLRFNLSAQSTIDVFAQNGKKTSITTNNIIESNSGDLLKYMAIQGHGITYLPTFMLYDAILESNLTRVLPDYTLPELHIYAVYPNNRFLSQRARSLIDFISEHCSGKPYWDVQFE